MFESSLYECAVENDLLVWSQKERDEGTSTCCVAAISEMLCVFCPLVSAAYLIRRLDVEVNAKPVHGLPVLFGALVLHGAKTRRPDSTEDVQRLAALKTTTGPLENTCHSGCPHVLETRSRNLRSDTAPSPRASSAFVPAIGIALPTIHPCAFITLTRAHQAANHACKRFLSIKMIEKK